MFDKFWGIPKLKAESEKLQRQLQAKDIEIQRLETHLAPFRTLALQRYPGTESKALKKLADQLVTLQEEVDALREYREVATYNLLGWKTPVSGMRMHFGTPVEGWTQGYLLEADEKKHYWDNESLLWNCESSALNHYKNMVKKYPKYPFPYYPLAVCLWSQGDETWEQYARKGISILERTTKIAGHNHEHDYMLALLRSLLTGEFK